MKKNGLALLVVTAACLAGCGDRVVEYRGTEYAPTTEVKTVFYFRQVPGACRVFRHLLITFPADYTGGDMQDSVYAEATSLGADLVFLGQSRQQEDDEGLQFLYYGPAAEYFFDRYWKGWKWGYDLWSEQGDWVGIGIGEWGVETVRFEFPVMTQAAFLRCRNE